MNILVISNLYPPNYLGGYELLCAQVCEQLVSKGHNVTVLTTHYCEIDNENINGVEIVRGLKLYLPFSEPPSLKRWQRLKTSKFNERFVDNYLIGKNYDVAFIWSQLRLTLGATRAIQKNDIPIVYSFNDAHITGYNLNTFNFSPKGVLRYFADHTLFKSITISDIDMRHSICISQSVKDELISKDIPVNDSRVIYQGIPIEKFPVKDNIGDINTVPRLLYVGQLLEYKGVHNLISAIDSICKNKGNNCLELTIVGKGDPDYEKRIKKQAEKINCDIKFKGYVQHSLLSDIYRQHDIFIFPSLYDGFGLTHLEAMASGLPVIATIDGGGHGEFLENRVNSLVYEKDNISQLANCIKSLCDNSELRMNLAINARKQVASDFSINNYADEINDFLNECLKE